VEAAVGAHNNHEVSAAEHASYEPIVGSGTVSY
jgi:hypothetical protein